MSAAAVSPSSGASSSATSPETAWSLRGSAIVGLATVALLVGGIGVWGTTARLSGAVIAHGSMRLEGRTQVVQHRDGGTVASILVTDGDRVTAGQALLVLDEAELATRASILNARLAELEARTARLSAERDGVRSLRMPDALVEAALADPVIAEILAGEASLFDARRQSDAEQRRALEEQIVQTRAEIDGLTAQRQAVDAQAALAADELASAEALRGDGLMEASRVLALEREVAGLAGRQGEIEAAEAQARGRIAEIEVQIIAAAARRREEAASELRDVESALGQARDEAAEVARQMARLTLTAPTEGIVHDLRVHSVGAVIRPADPVLFIVPQEDELVVTAMIDAMHVDVVQVGQPAILKFPAFNARITPEIDGTVARISPEATLDERTGASFYAAEVDVTAAERARLGEVQLLPGMPVEVYLETAPRSPLSLALKPLTDYLGRAVAE